MNRSLLAPLLVLILAVQSGCDQKDANKSATGAATTTAPSAAGLPAECQELMAALAILERCDKIPTETRMKIVDGYNKMLKVMIDANDAKMADGCRSGTLGVRQTLKPSGC